MKDRDPIELYDNLLVPMIVHGLYDFVALVYVTSDSQRVAGVEAQRKPQQNG